MIDRFLNAKHWQVALVTFGVPLLVYLYFVQTLMNDITAGTEPEFTTFFSLFKWIFLIAGVTMVGYYGWFWSVGVGLHKLIPPELKLNLTRFKAFLIFPAVYFLAFMGFMMMLMDGLLMDETFFMADMVNPGLFLLIIPFHLFAMFCMFYSMYFVSKTVKTAELQRKVKGDDYIGEFFMLWFFPVGIWILQPRINRLAEEMQGGTFYEE